MSARQPQPRSPKKSAARRASPRRGASRAAPAVLPVDAVRPFLKWAGGKRRLLAQMLPHVPAHERYFEPFVGGGAMFFAFGTAGARLSDTNERLVRTYRGLRDRVDDVIDLLATYPHEKDFFLGMRREDIDSCSDPEVAAWLIYLNKTAYNGLYRVNSRNGFNVPFGRYVKPNICDEPRLRACAARLRGVHIEQVDFEAAVAPAQAGDLVYFDPPYVPISATSDFTSYTSDGFGMPEQIRLRDVAVDLKQRGVHVLLSNSSAPAVRKLYGKGFRRVPIQARRNVNRNANGRGAITELLIR